MDRVLQRVSNGLACALICASALILLGWHFRIPLLKGAFLGTFVAPYTALWFAFAATSILLQNSQRRVLVNIGRILGLAVIAFALLTLTEWFFGLDLGIDRAFFTHRLEDWNLPVPGRMSVNSGIGFLICGIALLNIRRRSAFAEVLSGLIALLSYLSIIGYLYSVPSLYATGNVMALPTAILFMVLAAALLCSGSGQFLDIVLSPYAGGFVSRRIISAIVILLPLFGLVEIRLRASGTVSREFGIALLVLVSVLVFTILALRTAHTLNRIDRQRHETDAALRVSQDKQAESIEQLNLNLKRLRLIEGAVNVGTWEFDVTSGISYWPPGISTLWGLPRIEHRITLDQFLNSIDSEDRDRVSRLVASAIESGDTYDVEFRVVWPDKSVHWLSARGAVVRDETGRATKIIGIALEVTQRHQTERALRESEKLAATGRLAATIAHEINNPLEAVVNLVFLARRDETASASAREYLELADTELARISHMVRQTLGFYRESSFPVWIDVREMVEQLVHLYRNKTQRKNVQLTLQLEPARIFGLEGEIRQVVANLLSNAIDAVAADGRIVVRVREAANNVRIVVADNGHGILPQHRERIFQPFFTTKRDVGTGLGLWVSKGIVEKHDGSVRLRTSTRNGVSGTTFVIDFPRETTSLARTAAQAD
jgi:PAS domain S-box-containing protein